MCNLTVFNELLFSLDALHMLEGQAESSQLIFQFVVVLDLLFTSFFTPLDTGMSSREGTGIITSQLSSKTSGEVIFFRNVYKFVFSTYEKVLPTKGIIKPCIKASQPVT